MFNTTNREEEKEKKSRTDQSSFLNAQLQLKSRNNLLQVLECNFGEGKEIGKNSCILEILKLKKLFVT